MKLHEAYPLAERIKRVLAPHCDKIEIAGSIRRARDHVNDIDIVLLPHAGNDAAEELRRLLRKCPVVKDGRQMMVVRSKEGIQIDVWFAHHGAGDMFERTPSNWGTLLLCRTGSMEHNIWLAQRAQAMDLKWETSRGLVANPGTVKEKIIASETEEEIFQCLGLEFIPPALRERQVSREAPKEAKEKGPDWAESFSTP